MYLVKMSFSSEAGSSVDPISHSLNDLLAVMRMNGQICGREWSLITTPEGYATFVIVPEQDALEDRHRNKYVHKALDALGSAGLSQPILTVLGEDIDGDEICTCGVPEMYILYTNYLSLESPLRCGNCYLPVPLYRLPPTYEDEYSDIICWQSDYQSCDSLQMNCQTLERAATREISRVDSSLSLRGRDICNKIFEMTGRPTYYYLYPSGSRNPAQALKRRCPSCNGEWRSDPPWHRFDFKCDICRLVSRIP